MSKTVLLDFQYYWIFLAHGKFLMNFGKSNSKIFGFDSLDFGSILTDRLVTVKGRHWSSIGKTFELGYGVYPSF